MSSIYDTVDGILEQISVVIWFPIYVLLMCLGIYFSVKTNFFQIRKFAFMIKRTVGLALNQKRVDSKGAFTPWQALTTSLASTIGTGNIVGVSVAIVRGGPGAVFWMWFLSIFGMLIKYAEVVLALKFREKNDKGEWSGGPMYYIKNGMKQNWLATVFAFFLLLTSFTGGNLIQVHSIVDIVSDHTHLPFVYISLFVAFLVGLVIMGGMKTIGSVTEKIVPVMSLLYVLGSLFTLALNYKLIPSAIISIFREAFKLKSAGAGLTGYGIAKALHNGISRGSSSSEAGLGTAPIAQAASNLKEPVEQALYGILEVFVSAIVICTSTALVILTGKIYDVNTYSRALANGQNGLKANKLVDGVILSARSFATAMGTNKANLFIMLCIIFFSMSTIIGYFYYGSKAHEFLFKGKFLFIYKIAFILVTVLAPYLGTGVVWRLADITNGLMAIPNLIALAFLSHIVLSETKKYFSDQKSSLLTTK